VTTGYKTGGRQKGTPNKSTQAVRDAIAIFAQDNVGRLQEWLERIAQDDPAKASDVFIKLLEYHVPKLSRSDDSLLIDGDVDVNHVAVGFIDPDSTED